MNLKEGFKEYWEKLKEYFFNFLNLISFVFFDTLGFATVGFLLWKLNRYLFVLFGNQGGEQTLHCLIVNFVNYLGEGLLFLAYLIRLYFDIRKYILEKK